MQPILAVCLLLMLNSTIVRVQKKTIKPPPVVPLSLPPSSSSSSILTTREEDVQVEYEGPDQYGQLHPIETPQLLKSKLAQFDVELDKIPIRQKRNVVKALQVCPQLLTNDFKLWFLRCDIFNARAAARRFCHYWDKRVEIFGPSQAFGPLTLSKMNDDKDVVARECGVFNIFESTHGRVVAFEMPSRYSLKNTSRNSYLRAFWYIVHAALENVETQKRGIIVLNYSQGVNLKSQRDLKMLRILTSLKAALPLRLSAYHICHPPQWVSYLFPLVIMLVGERIRKQVLVHSGTQAQVLEELQTKYGLHAQDLPVQLGGGREVDMVSFLAKRKANGL